MVMLRKMYDDEENPPIMSASTKAQTGNCVSHTSMTTIPKMNISTENDISTLSRLASGIDALTE
jgi:hypothetical protein